MAHFDDVVSEVRALACSHLRMAGTMQDAPTDLQALLQELQITLVSEPCWDDPSFTGSTFIGEDGFRLIVVNSLLSRPRWAFTVAHEIAHIVMEHRPPRRGCIEKIANIYASEVLMPAERVAKQIRRYGGDVPYLAGLNGVSFHAMSLRLQELGIMLAQDCAER